MQTLLEEKQECLNQIKSTSEEKISSEKDII